MNKEQLFKSLKTCDLPALLNLLSAAYDALGHDERQEIFGPFVKAQPPARVDGEELLDEIEGFQRESVAGVFYAPFSINSKNWTHVPEETLEWFEQMGDLLQASAQLTAQGDHLHAVACFSILYKLIDTMENGEEIVFGDEIGSWMIPGDEKQIFAAYMTSLAAVATPAEFTAAALPLIEHDSYRSFTMQAYAAAIRAASEAQRSHLDAAIAQRKVRTQ